MFVCEPQVLTHLGRGGSHAQNVPVPDVRGVLVPAAQCFYVDSPWLAAQFEGYLHTAHPSLSWVGAKLLCCLTFIDTLSTPVVSCVALICLFSFPSLSWFLLFVVI